MALGSIRAEDKESYGESAYGKGDVILSASAKY